MALFAGTYENKIDKKGRVSLPPPFRAQMPKQGPGRMVYVYRSPNLPALEACDPPFMERIAESLEQYEMFSDAEADMGAVILADARPLTMDPEGRITIPDDFMAFAGIGDLVAFAGYGRRFHMWEPARLQTYTAESRTRVKGQTFRLKPTGPQS